MEREKEGRNRFGAETSPDSIDNEHAYGYKFLLTTRVIERSRHVPGTMRAFPSCPKGCLATIANVIEVKELHERAI